MTRADRAIEILKEAYNIINSGDIANIEFTERDNGSFTELLVVTGDRRLKLKIGRGRMKNWR